MKKGTKIILWIVGVVIGIGLIGAIFGEEETSIKQQEQTVPDTQQAQQEVPKELSEKELCALEGGTWTIFRNGCAGTCGCPSGPTDNMPGGCYCGQNKCWNGNTCESNAPFYPGGLFQEEQVYLVTRVIDGDTIEIQGGDRVRLICMDTPETGEEGFSEATNFLKDLILNKEVKLVKDVSETDRYGRIKGMYVFSDVRRAKSDSYQNYNVDSKGQLRVGAAIGVGEDAYQRASKLIDANVDVVVIDTAHGDSEDVLETIRTVKRNHPGLEIVAGNVSEPDSVTRLIEAGADGVKVGQGPGSICTTRVIAGIGSPQVTSVNNCSNVADEYGVPINADGGLRYSGDITIAIGAGAQSVMLGSMLAGVEETPGKVVLLNGRQWKDYRGMGSMGAMESHRGSRERYSQNDNDKATFIPEGVEGLVPYIGKLEDVIHQYVGGLRSGMGYVGASSISELRKKAKFIRISQSGQVESHPHNIQITRSAPNYPN